MWRVARQAPAAEVGGERDGEASDEGEGGGDAGSADNSGIYLAVRTLHPKRGCREPPLPMDAVTPDAVDCAISMWLTETRDEYGDIPVFRGGTAAARMRTYKWKQDQALLHNPVTSAITSGSCCFYSTLRVSALSGFRLFAVHASPSFHGRRRYDYVEVDGDYAQVLGLLEYKHPASGAVYSGAMVRWMHKAIKPRSSGRVNVLRPEMFPYVQERPAGTNASGLQGRIVDVVDLCAISQPVLLMKDHDAPGKFWVNSWLYMFDDVKETQFSLKDLLPA